MRIPATALLVPLPSDSQRSSTIADSDPDAAESVSDSNESALVLVQLQYNRPAPRAPTCRLSARAATRLPTAPAPAADADGRVGRDVTGTDTQQTNTKSAPQEEEEEAEAGIPEELPPFTLRRVPLRVLYTQVSRQYNKIFEPLFTGIPYVCSLYTYKNR